MSMIRVEQVIQSPGNDPVTIKYYRGEDHVKALSALMTAASEKDAGEGVPESVRFVVLSAEIIFEDA